MTERARTLKNTSPYLSDSKLVAREDNVMLSLSRRSVEFFKRAAKQRRMPCQRMIHALVDAFAEKQGRK
jgi:hypothetical protein